MLIPATKPHHYDCRDRPSSTSACSFSQVLKGWLVAARARDTQRLERGLRRACFFLAAGFFLLADVFLRAAFLLTGFFLLAGFRLTAAGFRARRRIAGFGS